MKRLVVIFAVPLVACGTLLSSRDDDRDRDRDRDRAPADGGGADGDAAPPDDAAADGTTDATADGGRLACHGPRDCGPAEHCCIGGGKGTATSSCKMLCLPGENTMCWLDEEDSSKVGCPEGTSCTGRSMDDLYGLPNAPDGICE